MPSGAVGTSILNSLANNLCVLSALVTTPEWREGMDYEILVYGDDVIYATEPPILPQRIKNFYDSENTGLIVTPAAKTGEFPSDTTIWDVTFLKRRFIPDPMLPLCIHPTIDPDTYEQSVMFCRDGDFQQHVNSLALLAWHAGPLKYRAWCDTVAAKAEENGVEVIFPPYSLLRLSWLGLLTG